VLNRQEEVNTPETTRAIPYFPTIPGQCRSHLVHVLGIQRAAGAKRNLDPAAMESPTPILTQDTDS
jgi:hypothetical protein